MSKKIFVILTCLLALCGCQKNVPADSNPAQLSPEEFNSQLKDTLAQHPELIMDILRDNKVEVLDIVEQGVDARRKSAEENRLQKELKNPLKTEFSMERPYLGASNAPVEIIAYSDFLCPYCKRGAKTTAELLKENPGRIKYAFRHFVRDEFSAKLARTFEAIALQDSKKAWEFYKEAFDNQSELVAEKDAELNKILEGLDLDMDRLAKDVKSPKIVGYIKKDVEEADSFGFRGTPSFIVNGVSIRGAYPKEKFVEVMDMVAPEK
ncbi:MAG: DsbA family protein [Desulfovibrio sp.]|uniref:DsbA family protein n=1 Tax=Desulfovibrio sp. 7SRBS1 TaxID=3378064 RepID=UPI003B3FC800